MEPCHDWRVFWNATVHCWKACRWDSVGGVCSADNLEVHAPFTTVGPFMRFQNCEAKIGTAKWIQNGDIKTEMLRLVPRSQVIEIETIRMRGA